MLWAKLTIPKGVQTKTNLLISISMDRSSWKPIHAQPAFQWISTRFCFHKDKCDGLLEQGEKKKMSKNIRKVDLIAWTKRLDRTLPFPYHFVHVEGPSSDFFYLPPAQIQFSGQSTQYSTQLFQQPGRCSSPGSLMPFSVFIGVISISLRM